MQRQATQQAFKSLYRLQISQRLRAASTSSYANWQNAYSHENYVEMEKKQKRRLSAVSPSCLFVAYSVTKCAAL